jgi:hypothetical protein
MASDSSIAIVDTVCDVEETSLPFGKRYGQEKLTLTAEHLKALQAGKMLALDVQAEYVIFVELEGGGM